MCHLFPNVANGNISVYIFIPRIVSIFLANSAIMTMSPHSCIHGFYSWTVPYVAFIRGWLIL
jgi:hypothetical protein